MTSKVTLYQHHSPSLNAGEYEIKATQELFLNEEAQTWPAGHNQKLFKFKVEGYKYFLPSFLIHDTYPPPGQTGKFSGHLPHIVLKQGTLPWERSPAKTAKTTTGQDEKTPWMALLTFSKTELDKKLVTIESETQGTGKDAYRITKLSMKADFFRRISPTPKEMVLLSHGRKENKNKLAVIIGNRMPTTNGNEPLQNQVHLVSLEKGEITESDPIQFYSLYSWSFSCEQDNGTNNNRCLELLQGLKKTGPLGIVLTEKMKATAPYLQNGYYPMKLYLDKETPGYAWYRSPLAPGDSQKSPAPKETITHAEAARVKEKGTNWWDMSHALAFGLGQMMALNDLNFLSALSRWKSLKTKTQIQAPSLDFLNLILGSKVDFSSENSAKRQLEKTINTWLLKLIELEAIPFNYLIPNIEALPEESISFFMIDNQWIKSLLSGAVSPGMGETYPIKKLNPLKRIRTGFIFRSQLVAGWPDLTYSVKNSTEESLNLIRKISLAPQVVICLYEGKVNQIEVSLKPGTAHFSPSNFSPSKKIKKRSNAPQVLHLEEITSSSIEFASGLLDTGFHWVLKNE